MFYKKGVLRNFTKFTGKHLCQSLFFNKVADLRRKCYRTLLVAASEDNNFIQSNAARIKKKVSLTFQTILTWKNLCFTEKKLIEIQGWLLLTFFIVLLIPLLYRCLKNVIHQIGSKNEWLLLSVTLTAKLELVFVLTFENVLSYSFHFKANRKSVGSSKKRY